MRLRCIPSLLCTGICIAVLAGCSGTPQKSVQGIRPAPPPDLRPDIVVMSGSVTAVPTLRPGMEAQVVAWGNPHDIERNFHSDRNLQEKPKTIEVSHPSLRRYVATELDGHQLILIATKKVVGAALDPTQRRYCSKRGDECVTVIGNYVTMHINGVEQVMPKEQFFKVVYPDGYFLLIAAMAVRDAGPQEVLVFMPKR